MKLPDGIFRPLLITALCSAVCPILPAYSLSGDTSASTNIAEPLQFVVVFDGPLDARHSWSKEAVVAHLKGDLKLNGRVAATAGAVVRGHVEPVDRKGDIIGPQAMKGRQLPTTTPFRVVFDEIISSGDRKLMMHAVPADQCSMVNKGKHFRSVEVAGGVVKTSESLDTVSDIQLQPGDELVVRVSQKRSTPKQTAMEPIVDTSTPGSDENESGPAEASDSSARASADSGAADHSSKAAATTALSGKSAALPKPEAAGGRTDRARKAEAALSTSETAASTSETAAKISAAAVPAETASKPESGGDLAKTGSGIAENSALSKSDPDAKADPDTKSDPDAKSELSAKNEETSVTKIDEQDASKSAATSTAENRSSSGKTSASAAGASGTSALKKGIRTKPFRISMKKALFTKSVRVGDKMQAVLVEDMKLHGQVVAKTGSVIYGHVAAVRHSCRWAGAIMAKEARFQRDAAIKLAFDKIITPQGAELFIDGYTPEQDSVFNNGGAFKKITVAPNRELIKDESVDQDQQSMLSLSKNIAQIGATAMMGPAATIAAPLLVIGALGKAEPAIAYSVHKTFIGKGDEIYIAPGDEVVVQARLFDSEKDRMAVTGKVVARSKKLKTIQTASKKQNLN